MKALIQLLEREMGHEDFLDLKALLAEIHIDYVDLDYPPKDGPKLLKFLNLITDKEVTDGNAI